TIRLPDELKARVAAAAERAGTSPHGFILAAIAEKAAQDEQRLAFEALAQQRCDKLVASGRSVPWSEMRRYLEARASGPRRRAPPPGSWRADGAGMATRIEFAPEVVDDFDRIIDHLVRHGVADAAARIEAIVAAIDVLQLNPLIGWPAGAANRESVIGQRSRGCLALYRCIAAIDAVFVLAIRSQSEAGYAAR
ncbi:MAG TPA: type II toxin-antitoxin system RelE/ParE family toxin, partial [Rubrivivax sp.]|nr:type II toxin-antitoxin system RelE/ParE family toxin [Rubrivivax sp.]